MLLVHGGLDHARSWDWVARVLRDDFHVYALDLLAIALELAKEDPSYEDVASKFWEHFLYIARAMNNRGDEEIKLWNEEDGFFYDVLEMPDGSGERIKVRSMVGLLPLAATAVIPPDLIANCPKFKKRLDDKGIKYSDYGGWAMSGWHQIFFYDPDGNVIEVHQAPEGTA